LIFSIARRADLAGIELVVSPEVALVGVERLRGMSEEYKVPILSLHQPMLPMPGWPKSWRALPRMLMVAEELGVTVLVVHPPKIRSWDEEEGRSCLETLESGRERARRFSATVTVENSAVLKLGRDDRYVLSDVSALSDLVARLGLGVTLDVAHVVNTSHSLAQAYEILKPRVRNIHFSNVGTLPWPFSMPRPAGYLEHHVMPDGGKLALAPLLEALAGDGYDGILTFEINPVALRAWTPSSALERVRRAADYVRQALRPSKNRQGNHR
jgi:sugar phosphate isomerase/epimerase